MLLEKKGALTIQRIRDLWKHGYIKSHEKYDDTQIQPASLDLRLSRKCWKTDVSFLPGKNKTVSQKLSILSAKEIDIKEKIELIKTKYPDHYIEIELIDGTKNYIYYKDSKLLQNLKK